MCAGPHLYHPDNMVLSCAGTLFINMTVSMKFDDKFINFYRIMLLVK